RPVKNRPVKNRPVKNRPVKHKPVNNTSVKFSRTKKRDPVHKIVLRAYSEFKNKNYKQSENLYNNALNMDKKNRDALLGLAAIAVKQQRYEFARKKYNRILRLNPGDSIATAGLIGIDKQADSQLSESRIKFMLRDEPDAAPLHFALGNIYSKEKKWPDAQKSYFNAWSVDDKNSDYAFNLAVSLDHLNKKKQALKFYLTSLKLKHENGGNFSTAGVETRINSLKKSLR
ncbi:MAG TPA: tetratricopeptide repeat protein, partial [Gammaproteobacteria bacterium]|nr:tetratricopeptide repeat protein [Gammaproteobacteria bacterium]